MIKHNLKMLVTIVTLLFLLTACGKNKIHAVNGFDKICQIYTDVFTNAKYNKLSDDDKYQEINDKIKKNVFSVNAIQAITAIAQADPHIKYKLFKEAAEYSLKHTWDCPLMAARQKKYNAGEDK